MNGHDDPREYVARLDQAMAEMAKVMEDVDWDLFSPCDCGHRKLEHDRPGAHNGGLMWCRHGECQCGDFSDLHQQAERWRRGQLERERKVADLAERRARRNGAAA